MLFRSVSQSRYTQGLIDRFRSLPISQSALVIGRTLGDSLLNIVVLAVMGIAGFVVGWRPSGGIGKVALGFLFLLFFGYALSWVGVLVGLSASDARVVQNVSFIVHFLHLLHQIAHGQIYSIYSQMLSNQIQRTCSAL